MDAKLGGRPVQVDDELVHAHATAHVQQARAGAGHHTHGTAGLLDMLGALHVEAGRGTVDAVGVAEGHDGGAGVVGRQVRATV